MRQIRIGKVVLTDGGDWNASTGYSVLTYVRHNGDGWWSFKANVNSEPKKGNPNWVQATDVQELVNRLKALEAEMTTLNTQVTQAESARVTAETLRNEAEGFREVRETDRINSETDRKVSETSRREAETQRVAAENKRVADFNTAMQLFQRSYEEAEASRNATFEQNEQSRQEAETNRVTAESAREIAEAKRQENVETQVELAKTATANATEKANYAKEQGDYAKGEGAKIAPAIKAMDDTFASKEAQRDAAMETISHEAEKLVALERHLGIYAKNLPVTLTPYATDKMLTAINGMVSEVAQTGWGISRLTPEMFTFGDTVFLKMVDGAGQNLMVEGAVLFASEEEIRDAEGQVVSRRVTSLFKASNTDVPLSGEVLKDLGLKGMNLLISHPLAVSAVEIGRSGRGASMATLESNMRDEMERYSPKNARILSLTAGQAVAMEPGRKYGGVNARKGQLLMSRPLCDADGAYEQGGVVIPSDGVENVSVTIDGMRGDVIGGNQMVNMNSWYGGSKATYISPTHIKVVGVNTLGAINTTEAKIQTGHKTLFLLNVIKNNIEQQWGLRDGYTGGNSYISITKPYAISTKTDNGRPFVVQHSLPLDTELDLEYEVVLLDLTTLFPTPSGQQFVASLTNNTASVQRVLHRLGFFAFEEQID